MSTAEEKGLGATTRISHIQISNLFFLREQLISGGPGSTARITHVEGLEVVSITKEITLRLSSKSMVHSKSSLHPFRLDLHVQCTLPRRMTRPECAEILMECFSIAERS